MIDASQVMPAPSRFERATLRLRRRVGRMHQEFTDRTAYRRIARQLNSRERDRGESTRSRETGTILFTTHKSASTLMMQLLRQVSVLSWARYFDYERCLWRNGDRLPIANHAQFLTDHAGSLFRGYREIYGPIRYPIPINLEKPDQLQTLFFLRDPRDVLISAFHSFGQIHPVPKNAVHAAEFLKERALIQAEGLDGFALRKAEQWMNPTLKGFRAIRDRSAHTKTIHYQTFYDDPVGVAVDLLDALGETRQPIRRAIVAFLEQQVPYHGASVTHRSNPTHIRSGANRQFENALAPQTVQAVTDLLADELVEWGFSL